MIENFYPKERYGGCRSTGCSCCSCEYDIAYDKKKILKEVEENIRVAKKVCKHYKIPFENFAKKIAMNPRTKRSEVSEKTKMVKKK